MKKEKERNININSNDFLKHIWAIHLQSFLHL